MKDAARLLGYFAATIFFGALCAPILFWVAQSLAAHGIFQALASYDFESFFHRALMLGAVVFLWPLLRWAGIRKRRELGLVPNRQWARDAGIGFLLAAGPLLCFGILLLKLSAYALRPEIDWIAVGTIALAALVVPLIEEALFRGVFLGMLLRGFPTLIATLLSAAIFSIVHFLKAPERTITLVKWDSGFISIANSFGQFGDPLLLLAGFTTLFLIGWILAEARIRTRSLWLPIGLHAGWILTSGVFNRFAQQASVTLPWLGKSLLIGLAPLSVGLITWTLMRGWLQHARTSGN